MEPPGQPAAAEKPAEHAEGVAVEFAEFDLDRSTARAWSQFQARLADHVAAMTDDDVLIVEADAGGNDDDTGVAPYVQFVAWGDDRIRCEVSSNEHLAARYALDAEATATLQSLGWSFPDSHADDESDTASSNFHLDSERGSADKLAVMAVKALRGVFGVAHPAFLSARNLGAGAVTPDLGIPSPMVESAVQIHEPLAVVPDDVDHLRTLVDEALEPVFGHGPNHDSDGDIPVVAGSALLFVRVLEDAPAVEMFSTVVRGVSNLDEAAVAVGEFNNGIRLIKFLLVDDVIIAVAHVPAMPFAPQQLRSVLDYMSRIADGIDDGLAARVGGRPVFQDQPGDRTASSTADEDFEMPAELETLLHLNADEQSPVDPDLAASVCGYDRDVVLRLLKIASQQEITWRRSQDEAAMQGDRDEAAARGGDAARWAKTVETLRSALRVIVERDRR